MGGNYAGFVSWWVYVPRGGGDLFWYQLVGTYYRCASLPVPAVYPTRHVTVRTGRVGSGRVDVSRVGLGTDTTSTGTGIPGFTRNEHDFGARTFLFLYVF